MQPETAYFAPGEATWRTERNIRVVFDSDLFPELYENVTLSTKPELGLPYILPCRQRRTEPRPQVTCTEHVVKFGRVVFDIRLQTDIYDRPLTEINVVASFCALNLRIKF